LKNFWILLSLIPPKYISQNLTKPTLQHPTKDEILDALQSVFFNDLAFLEEINNFTYLRKTQLKRRDRKLNQTQDGEI